MLNFFKKTAKAWRREKKFPLLVSILSFFWIYLKHLKYIWRYLSIKRKLIKTSSESHSTEELLNMVWNDFNGIFKPIQNPDEIEALINLYKELSPKNVLEIGTAFGGTLFLLTRSSALNSHVISLDLPSGWFGGGYPRWKTHLYKTFARTDTRIDLIRKNSHEESTFQHVKRLLKNEKIDFIFIDGDHTYTGVKDDFERYKTLLKKNGVIALHDVNLNLFDSDIDVHRFWCEIKQQYKTEEFIANKTSPGIGVIYFGDMPVPKFIRKFGGSGLN